MNRPTMILVGVASVFVAIAAALRVREPTQIDWTAFHAELPDFSTAISDTAPSQQNVRHDVRAELATLRARLEDDPNDTLTLAALADLLQAAHQSAKAVRYYERYLAIDSTSRDTWLGLAHSYGTLKRWDEALAASQSLLALHPEDVGAMYNIGAIYANTGQYDQARMWWRRVTARGDDDSISAMAEKSLGRISTVRTTSPT